MKASFSKDGKMEKYSFRNILHRFEFLLKQAFVYAFAVIRLFRLDAEIFDFKKRLNFDCSIFKKHVMKKLLLLSILSLTFYAQAQMGTSTQLGGENSKWTFGGSAGLGGSFGSNNGGTSIYVSPRIGYKLTESVEAGIVSDLTWTNAKYYSSNTIGVGPFVNYYIARNFYLSGMFQEYFFNQKNKVTNVKYSGDEAALYFGGGYMQRIGERAYMQIGGMYNVLYKKDDSVFGSGFVPSVGVVFGL